MRRAGRNSHCSYCGARFADTPWPRTCASCGTESYVNPAPVAVMLVPADGGLLAVRRAIPPRIGELALPGGFINLGESWQQAAAREVLEETGVVIDPGSIREHRVLSPPDGAFVLIFGVAPPLAAIPELRENAEVSELVILREPAPLAFPLHTEVVAAWFAAQRS
jgi:ADP-ribose pyrophosphatase YjhB (NUDIX family)